MSWLWELILSGLTSLRFGVIFSDPLTGFRVYRRGRLPQSSWHRSGDGSR